MNNSATSVKRINVIVTILFSLILIFSLAIQVESNRKNAKMTCNLVLDQVQYEWQISDTGIGMKPEFLEHIFEPFAQERTAGG